MNKQLLCALAFILSPLLVIGAALEADEKSSPLAAPALKVCHLPASLLTFKTADYIEARVRAADGSALLAYYTPSLPLIFSIIPGSLFDQCLVIHKTAKGVKLFVKIDPEGTLMWPTDVHERLGLARVPKKE